MTYKLNRVVQNLFLASAKNAEDKAPSNFMSHAVDRLLKFLLMKVGFQNFWAHHQPRNKPRTFRATCSDHNHLTAYKVNVFKNTVF